MNLLTNPSLLTMGLTAVILTTSIVVYAGYNYTRELDKFRANLSPGTIVKVKATTRTFRARIVIRVTEIRFIVRDIDTKENLFMETKNIYQP